VPVAIRAGEAAPLYSFIFAAVPVPAASASAAMVAAVQTPVFAAPKAVSANVRVDKTASADVVITIVPSVESLFNNATNAFAIAFLAAVASVRAINLSSRKK
jgi:hypothetical protein